MEGLEQFNALLGQRIRELIPVQTTWAIVKEVDWTNKTMTATGVTDDLDYFNILLGLGSEYRKPVVGSKCLIGIIEKSNNGFLIIADEIEAIEIYDKSGFKWTLNNGLMEINGDSFGGIVNAKELKLQVDKNTALLNQIKTMFQSWTPIPEDGGAALKALSGSLISMPVADLSNIENTKIKHGG